MKVTNMKKRYIKQEKSFERKLIEQENNKTKRKGKIEMR